MTLYAGSVQMEAFLDRSKLPRAVGSLRGKSFDQADNRHTAAEVNVVLRNDPAGRLFQIGMDRDIGLHRPLPKGIFGKELARVRPTD